MALRPVWQRDRCGSKRSRRAAVIQHGV